MHFHQIFSIALPSEDIQFLSFLQLFSNSCCHSNAFNILGSERFPLLLILRLCMVLYQIFRIALPQDYLHFVSFWLLMCNQCCYGDSFSILGSERLELFYGLNLFMDFHQIFSIALPSEIKSFSAFSSYFPQQHFPAFWGLKSFDFYKAQTCASIFIKLLPHHTQ